MAWGTEVNETKDNLTATEVFSANIPMNPGETVHVEIDVDFIVSPTDNVIISVYGSIDNANHDNSPLMSMRIDKDVDPNQLSFIIRGLKSFKIGLKMDGGTDTTTDAVINWTLDGVSL